MNSIGSGETIEVGTIESVGNCEINALVMINPAITWTKEPLKVGFYLKNGEKSQLIDSIEVIPGEPVVYEHQFEAEKNGEIEIGISDNYSLDIDVIYLVNFEIQ